MDRIAENDFEHQDFTHAFLQGSIYERQRFSRELHDGLAQELLGVRMQLLALEQSDLSTDVGQMVAAVHRGLLRSLQSLQAIISDGVPESFVNRLFEDVLSEVVNVVGGLSIECTGSSSLMIHQNGIGMELLRVVQEFIQNSIKHAQASKITVHLADLPHGIRIQIEDDGQGFQIARAKKGRGMENMQFRLDTIAATYQYTSVPGLGTQLIINAYDNND